MLNTQKQDNIKCEIKEGIQGLNEKWKSNTTNEDVIKSIASYHQTNSGVIKKNNKQKKEESKKLNFEREDKSERKDNLENRINNVTFKGNNWVNYVQAVFMYNPNSKQDKDVKILKDDSSRHLNTPPSPRFGDMSLSFGNDHDTRSSGFNMNFTNGQK